MLKPSSPRAEFNLLKVALLSAVVGILGGIAAEILEKLIGFVINLSFYQRLDTHIVPMGQHRLGPLVIFIPAIGGLIVGFLARYGSELVRGHGIPEAMQAVLTKQSRIPPRVAVLKPISAAVSIGTGGPFGAEGPVIGLGAALGSIIGQALRTTPPNAKSFWPVDRRQGYQPCLERLWLRSSWRLNCWYLNLAHAHSFL